MLDSYFVFFCQYALKVFIKKDSFIIFSFDLYFSVNNNRIFLDLYFYFLLLHILKASKNFLFGFLSPNQIGLTLIISEGPPKSIGKNGFDELRIIASSNVNSIPFSFQTIILNPKAIINKCKEKQVSLEFLL